MLPEHACMEGVISALTVPCPINCTGPNKPNTPGRVDGQNWEVRCTQVITHPWFESNSALRKDGVFSIEFTHRTRSNRLFQRQQHATCPHPRHHNHCTLF